MNLAHRFIQDRFFIFCIVGGLGFVVDLGILFLLLSFGFHPLLARTISAACSLTVTWLFNRTYTFRQQRAAHFREWLSYNLFNGVGLAINLGLYSGLVIWTSLDAILAMMVGAGTALIFNYTTSRLFVFRSPGN